MCGVLRGWPGQSAEMSRGSWLANTSALYRGQKPQDGEKRDSESKKPHYPLIPENGVSSQKNHFPCGAL